MREENPRYMDLTTKTEGNNVRIYMRGIYMSNKNPSYMILNLLTPCMHIFDFGLHIFKTFYFVFLSMSLRIYRFENETF